MRIICLTLLLLLSKVSFAQIPVVEGQPSPEDGIFLTKEQAAKILSEKQAAEKICKINSEAETDKQKAKCDFDKALLNNELQFEKKKFDEILKLRDGQDKILYDRIDDAGTNPYYFFGGVATGTVVTGLVVVGTMILIEQIGK
jgi:hypothetical protein